MIIVDNALEECRRLSSAPRCMAYPIGGCVDIALQAPSVVLL